METVKVDIKKLQMLNDRINQTIDALTQLRQSVHGYQQTLGLQHTQAAQPVPQTFGQIPFGYAAQPQPQQVAQQPWFGVGGGISHSPADYYGRLDPRVDPRVDPMTMARISQNFPWAFNVIPPVVSL